jgi:transcriptional regulator with XRE-family HTH domain
VRASLVYLARIDKGMSGSQLADAADVHPRFVQRLEARSTQRPNVEALGRVAKVLELNPSDIARDLSGDVAAVGPRVIREDYRADGTIDNAENAA